MAKLKQLLWALAAIPLLTACSNNDFPEQGGSDLNFGDGDGVFMTVNFSPVDKGQTRSYTDGDDTSSHGVETGTQAENYINRVLLVLTTVDNEYVASATVENEKMSISTDKTIYQATAKFAKTDIAEYYANVPDGQTSNPEIKVFVYCNPSNTLINKVTDELDPNSEDNPNWLDWTYKLASKTDDGIWRDKNFLMTNVSMAVRYFPVSLNAWNLYTTEANPFDLSGMNNAGTDNEVDNQTDGGAIKVQRAAVRFDFRDGSQMGPDDTLYEGETWNGNGVAGKPFTYAVMTTTDSENVSHTLIEAEIVNMSLVNMLNEEYYLKRVSENGLNQNIELLKPELPWFDNQYGEVTKDGNYVVSPYANLKSKPLPSSFETYFYYPFFDESGKVATRGTTWYTTRVKDVTSNNDKYPVDATGLYHRWRYVTENTIPGSYKNQVNSWSTGIVFKAKLKAGDALESSTDRWDVALKNTLNNTTQNGPILYFFSGKLYCGWDHVVAAALADAGFNPEKGQDQNLDRAASLFKAVYGTGGVGEIKDADGKVIYTDVEKDADGNLLYPIDPKSPNALYSAWKDNPTTLTNNPAWIAFRDAVVNYSLFTIYEKYGDNEDGWGYYCYYYYWNRHNDNYQNGVMGPMEFATVRNNVYKLAVTRLNTLGHPRIPENDPDTPKPDTPDEKSDLYLTVSVQVVPWVVRFNNIEFW